MQYAGSQRPDLDNYDGVVFDLFHTLVNLDGAAAPEQTAGDYLGISRTQWKRALFSNAEDRLRGNIAQPGEIIRDIACKIRPTLDARRASHAAQLRIRQFKHALSAVHPHILETVKRLKQRGKALGLISNADKIEASAWRGTEMAAYFDSAIFSCHVGYIKPEKAIYLSSLRDLQISSDRCLFVGDGGNDELAGAKRAGLDTVFSVEFLNDLPAQALQQRRRQADYEIRRIDELID